MKLTYPVVGLLRIVLALLFALLVLLQVMSIPGQFAHMAQEAPELAHLRWPLTALGVALLLCAEVVIVCIWRLLTMVKGDRIFSRAAFGWVDGIVWAVTAAWVLYLGASGALVAHVWFTPEIRDPGTPMALFVVALIGGVVVLLMVVMRALLRQAAALRSDLDEVI